MNDVEFVQLGKEVLKEMQYIDAWSEEATNLRNKMKKLKIHILNNPDNKFVQDFIEELINRYITLFFNQDLIDSLCIPQPFYRQIQVYRNLPSTTHQSYGVYLFDLLELSDFPDFYLGFLDALKKYRKEMSNHPHIQNILGFVDQNQSIIKGFKDDYYPLEEEKRLYQCARTGYNFKELEDFASLNQIMGQDAARNAFMNKRIGNIGELYVYELIKNKKRSCFVSKDIRNGFGYDLYFEEDDSKELLTEVKTTTRDIEDDSFDMSENEYKVMKQCFGNPNANYVVCRVKLNSTLTPTSYTLLVMIDNTTLMDIASGNVQYKLYPYIGRTIHFQKYTPKTKILMPS